MAGYEGRLDRKGHQTLYRVVGEPDAGPTPAVICHGGPGGAHDYVEPIADLSRYRRGGVLYDQLGCGHRPHLRDASAECQIFEDSSHIPHVEEPEAFLKTVEEFLARLDM